MNRTAIFNEDRSKRYLLTREDWAEGAKPAVCLTLCFIGVNPSKGDEHDDDQTVKKCLGFAKRWGYGRIRIVNPIPTISTDQWTLPPWRGFDEENYRHLENATRAADLVIVAWGSVPAGVRRIVGWSEHMLRVREILMRLRRSPMCIGRSANGEFPLHPSRTQYTVGPLEWDPTGRAGAL